MSIDKTLYRQAQEWYRQANEAERKARWDEAGKLSPQAAWQQYVDLWEFAMKLAPDLNNRQRQRTLAAWEEYYVRIQKLEVWRRTHGKGTGSTA
jgi:hypothetical protein